MAHRDEIELEDNESFQRVEWRLQRIGWLIWGLVILAALLGFLGSGFFSEAEAVASDGSLAVRYDRFARFHDAILLAVRPSDRDDGEEVMVKIAQPFLDRVRIHRIQPEPAGQQLAEDGVVFSFPRSDSGAGRIMFHIEYEQFGFSDVRLEIVGREPVKFSQVVYP